MSACCVENEDLIGLWIEQRGTKALLDDWHQWLRANGISGGQEFVARTFYRALEERGFSYVGEVQHEH